MSTTEKPTRNVEAGDLGLHEVMKLFADTDDLAAMALRLRNERMELLEACRVAYFVIQGAYLFNSFPQISKGGPTTRNAEECLLKLKNTIEKAECTMVG